MRSTAYRIGTPSSHSSWMPERYGVNGCFLVLSSTMCVHVCMCVYVCMCVLYLLHISEMCSTMLMRFKIRRSYVFLSYGMLFLMLSYFCSLRLRSLASSAALSPCVVSCLSQVLGLDGDEFDSIKTGDPIPPCTNCRRKRRLRKLRS